MDNQLFPGAGFLDDGPQMCVPCGLMFNNRLTYQHHMQLHFLSANTQMLVSQPPSDPGIGMASAAGILDLIGGVSLALSSNGGMPLVSPQTVFSGAVGSSHLISQGVGLVTAPIQNIGLPHQFSSRPKEKKPKTPSSRSVHNPNSNTSNSTVASQPNIGAGTSKSRNNNSSGTYLSTFPKDLQKLDTSQSKGLNVSVTQASGSANSFPVSSQHQLDPLEALILTSPVKSSASLFERQTSRKSTSSPQDSLKISKDSKKLFQPFVSADLPLTSSYTSRGNTLFSTEGLLSPTKAVLTSTVASDILSTPQKVSYSNSSTENLYTSSVSLPSTKAGDGHLFGMFLDSEIALTPAERKTDIPGMMHPRPDDSLSLKSHFFPSLMDPLNISPGASQGGRNTDTDQVMKMPLHQGSLDHSRSSSPLSCQTVPMDFTASRADSPRSLVSPKISPALPSGVHDSDSTSNPSMMHMFRSALDPIPASNVSVTKPPVFGSSLVSVTSVVSAVSNPAVDIAVNPLGTGYFNSLMQKLIDPTFSLGTDVTKTNTLGNSGGQDGTKGKITFENGVLINNDYDKISDTEDDDLSGLINGMDTKNDNIDTNRYELDDIFNELSDFNDKHTEDMKNKNQIDDFLKDVLEEPSKVKTETSMKIEETFNPSKEFEMNPNIISDLLEKEKEIIDKESKEMENARLNASGLLNTTTVPSTTATVSVPAVTSTVSTSASSEPKVSTSTDSGEKKEEDPVDFEIPKVGKLMKIRKYFEIQEQKRKEQTEKVTEVRIHHHHHHGKTDPPVEEKPQTILVQVSKRKKVEYGPYFNRQSLLEGKPKANIESSSPQKTPRPKPKPQVPEKRTFNLRERKTKTDFATLATTGCRTAEKKTEVKQKTNEPKDKSAIDKETKEESQENVETEKPDEEMKDSTTETKLQEINVESQVESKARSRKNSAKSENEEEKAAESVEENKQSELKSALRVRGAKTEGENVEVKNLRKRTMKSNTENTSSKAKMKKTDSAGTLNDSSETEEKLTRSKIKQKATPDKSAIKKCSVNLGEKYTESKAKCTVIPEKTNVKSDEIKVIESIESKGSELTEYVQVTEDEMVDKNTGLLSSQKEENTEKEDFVMKQDTLKSEDEVNSKQEEEMKGTDTVDGDANVGRQTLVKMLEPEKVVEERKRQAKVLDSVTKKVERRSKNSKTSRNETNIFDKLDQSDYEENKHVDDSQMVTITSSDNSDKKLTLKLKLGPNFQKAFEFFGPKKRKREIIDQSSGTVGEASNETAVDKRIKKSNEIVLETVVDKEIKTTNENINDTEDERKKSNENVIGAGEKLNEDKTITENVSEIKTSSKEQTDTMEVQNYEVNNPPKEIESNVKSDERFEREIHASEYIHIKKKVVKHSVENEFQRLVNEAMAEAQKEGDEGKQEKKLRRRLNDNVKYNVDESDDELNIPVASVIQGGKGQKTTPKSVRNQSKGLAGKAKLKLDVSFGKDVEPMKTQQPKKDMDVYDFTDTELSDTEDTTPKKLAFKPKYVSNLNLFGQKKPPFISKALTPVAGTDTSKATEVEPESEHKDESDNENACSESSYVGLTVEPLKIKLSKIKPFKEKRHKHKKKKKKREKERRDASERYDSESRDSMESRDSTGVKNVSEEVNVVQKDEKVMELSTIDENNEMKKLEDVKSIESVGQESNSNSNENIDEEQSENGNSSAGLVKGMKRSKLKEKKHICEYCNVGFGQKCDLRRHTMIHTGERPWLCEMCDKRFQRKSDLVKHVRTHTGEKPFQCEFCEKRVSDKSQLNVHRRLHTGDRPYCCEKCGKRCITSSELSRHKSVHCGNKVQKCILCKKAFTIKECLGMHMKLHYRSRSKAFKCEKCAIGFDKKTDLDNHHCVDPTKNLYICSECYEEFSDELLYAEHIKTHDLGVLACNVCTNIFEDKHSLETHLCSLGMEKQRQFTCDICNTEFQDQDSLAQHMVKHDNDQGSFMCDHCSEIFTVRRDFVEHLKLHDSPSQTQVDTKLDIVQNSPSQISEDARTEFPTHLKSPNQSFSKGLSGTDPDRRDAEDSDHFVTIKQEIDLNDFNEIQPRGDHLAMSSGINSAGGRLNIGATGASIQNNSHRASVISGTFRIDDESDSRQSSSTDTVPLPKLYSANNIGKSGKSSSTSNLTSRASFLDSERFFEPSDFTNSPDFSTLTEEADLDLDPFSRISDALRKGVDKGSKVGEVSTDKQIDLSASIDMKQKILKQFENSAQSTSTIPVSEKISATTSQRLNRQSSVGTVRNAPSLQNSRLGALLSSETTTTHSSNSTQYKSHPIGLLGRSASTGNTEQYHHVLPKMENPETSCQQNTQNKRWSGFHMSASDFVDSFLPRESKSGATGYGPKSFDNKSDIYSQSLSKSAAGSTINNLPQGEGEMFSKDNLENQIHSDIFSDFQMTSRLPIKSESGFAAADFKSTGQQNKYSNSLTSNAASIFQGINPLGFNTSQYHAAFAKSDFGSFANTISSQFQQSSFSSSASNSYLSSCVLPDVNKQHIGGVYASGAGMPQDSFYLPGMEDSMKDLTDSGDKSQDETAALLSNFDQF